MILDTKLIIKHKRYARSRTLSRQGAVSCSGGLGDPRSALKGVLNSVVTVTVITNIIKWFLLANRAKIQFSEERICAISSTETIEDHVYHFITYINRNLLLEPFIPVNINWFLTNKSIELPSIPSKNTITLSNLSCKCGPLQGQAEGARGFSH